MATTTTVANKPKENPIKVQAEEAVQRYLSERETLETMRAEFETNFPDAAAFLEDIKQQQDLVQDAIDQAKPLVAQLGETIGDFLCKRKYSKPRYDNEAFTKLVGENEDGALVVELIKNGCVKAIDLNDGATAWFASHPSSAETYQPAWKDKEELTPAVTVPKLG